MSVTDGTTKGVPGTTSILPKTPQTQATNQIQPLIRIGQARKFNHHLKRFLVV